jgi:hypothetical protein
MSVFDENPAPPSRRGPRLLMAFAGAAVAIGGAWFVLSPRQPRPPVEESRPAPTRPRPEPKRTPTPSRDTPAATDRPAGTRDATAGDPGPADTAAPTRAAGVLRVRSDVPGASVFLDRKFLGNTPLDVDGLDPGSHRLNVSVEGYEGYAQAIEIGDTPAEVTIRFKDVVVNASLPVVHKHGVGSCTGRLVADTSGLRYESSHAGDAFGIAFADLETFAVDYLKKNLRVKKRGGRTWNFEDPNGQADPLFVFHRDVEKARARLTRR